MANLISTSCPGCKKVLRVPEDWVNKVVRCKFCNTTMKIRANPSVPKAPSPTPVQRPGNVPTTHPGRVANPAPLSQPTDALNFENPEDADKVISRPYSSRRRSWLAPAILAFVMLAAGGTAAFFLMKYQTNANKLAQVDPKGDSPGENDPKTKTEGKDAKGPDEKEVSKKGGLGKESVASNASFPRRAMIVSIHNYLYANPIQYGLTVQGMKNIPGMTRFFVNQLRIPPDQVTHLSDVARENPMPPMKAVVESTVSQFLKTSRKQDRIFLVFIGHAVENDGKVYLAPIEGDLTAPATLIPLEWLYKELKECQAHQKILVLDVCRFNPAQGSERPGGEPMSAKMEEVIKAVPEGVQVITACAADQRSMETDGEPLGVFMDAFHDVLQRGVQGQIQRQKDNVPIETFFDSTKKLVEKNVAEQGFKQVPKLFGSFKDNGAEFDSKEPMPAKISIAALPKPSQEGIRFVKSVFDEISTPPVKASNSDSSIKFEYLPPISEKVIKDFEAKDGPETELQKAVKHARIELWAVSPLDPPADIKQEVMKVRAKVMVNLNVLKDGYRVPGNETVFKTQIEKDEKEVALMMLNLEEALKDLGKLEEKRDDESKRWQANYDFVRARLESQVAYLYEYQSALGQMRKELPPRDEKIHNGWKLAATAKLQGDSVGKKLAKKANTTMEKLVKDFPGSPYEVLAKREKFTALGLEWQPTK